MNSALSCTPACAFPNIGSHNYGETDDCVRGSTHDRGTCMAAEMNEHVCNLQETTRY